MKTLLIIIGVLLICAILFALVVFKAKEYIEISDEAYELRNNDSPMDLIEALDIKTESNE